MSAGGTSRRILSAALLLPLLLFAVASSSGGWLCRSDGIVRSSCCCPKKSAVISGTTAADAPGAEIGALGCCVVKEEVVDKAPTEPPRPNPTQLLAGLASLPVALTATIVCHAPPGFIASARGQPQSGRGVILQKRAFLI